MTGKGNRWTSTSSIHPRRFALCTSSSMRSAVKPRVAKPDTGLNDGDLPPEVGESELAGAARDKEELGRVARSG